jgi:hypothetical protein
MNFDTLHIMKVFLSREFRARAQGPVSLGPAPLCHSREGGNPGSLLFRWIPATNRGDDGRDGMDTRHLLRV